MATEFLNLLKRLLTAEAKEAEEICESILNTDLELPHFADSLVSILEMYYTSIALEYCGHKSKYAKAKLEKIISEIEGMLS